MGQERLSLENLLLPPREARHISNELPAEVKQFGRGFRGDYQEPGISDDLGAVTSLATMMPWGKLSGLARQLLSRAKPAAKLPAAKNIILPKATDIDPRVGTGGQRIAIPGFHGKDPNTAIYNMMIEREARKNAAMAAAKANAKKQANIPAFRSKSGMAVDVLDDMKKTPVPDEIKDLNFIRPQDEMDLFAPGMKRTSSVGYTNDLEQGTSMYSDPAKYVGNLRSTDESIAFAPPKVKTAEEMLDDDVSNAAVKAFGFDGRTPVEQPSNIDNLIQDLSDYFTSPKFDPFKKLDPTRKKGIL